MLKKPTTTATNNALNGNAICTIGKKDKIFSNTPKPEAKAVEAVKIQQGGTPSLDDRDSAVPPPPYESCPWKTLPKSGLDGHDIVLAAVDACFSSEPVHHAECEVINETPKYPLETAFPGDDFGGLGFSELGCGDFSGLGDETADLLAAFDFGGTYVAPDISVTNAPFSQSPTVEDTAEPGVVENINLNIEAPSVASSTSTSESLRELFSESPTPSILSNHQRGDGVHYSSSTPARRVPSFSEFDALGSDCSGCCLHQYTPTQILCSQSTHRNASTRHASSTPHTQVRSPQPGSLGVPTPRAYASPSHAQTPSVRDHQEEEHQEEVYPTAVISTALTATAKASQNLKRPLESRSCDCSSLQRQQHHNPDPQASDVSKADRARKNIRKLLEMQKTVTELLLDVLDDWPALSEGPPGKRQRQE